MISNIKLLQIIHKNLKNDFQTDTDINKKTAQNIGKKNLVE
jgi:hypothetical protein